jgi:hypothetical protein
MIDKEEIDAPQDPLDFIDFADIFRHGDPGTWISRGPKPGSPVIAHSGVAQPGTMKHYDLYTDEFGAEIEVHYFRHPDGSVGNVKVKD